MKNKINSNDYVDNTKLTKFKLRTLIYKFLTLIQIIILVILTFFCIYSFIRYNNPIDSSSESIEKNISSSFNSNFLNYEGKQKGNAVHFLFNTIKTNYYKYGYITTINGKSIDYIDSRSFKPFKYYTISFTYNNYGRISDCIIEEVQ